MKVALVHDYIKEFGGAERVLKALTEMFPGAPVYTAFRVRGSTADKEFVGVKIIESKLAPILKIGKLYSPLRFLIPVIWGGFDLKKFDLVITSSSWYVTRGFKIGKNTVVIDYCHTPPRWLYGYETSVNFTRYWPVKVYAAIVAHFMRVFDFNSAQEPQRNRAGVHYFLANSENVKLRIEKFYRRKATVIYPPVEVARIVKATAGIKKGDHFLIASRITGAKGIEEAINLSAKIGFKLKIVGERAGYSQIARQGRGRVEFLGRLTDSELYREYARAKGFLALAKDEDFGLTVVEAQAAGTPVLAFNGGGFRESVIDGKTGILVNSLDGKTIKEGIEKIKKEGFKKEDLIKNAERFSKERFVRKMLQFVRNVAK